MGMWSSQRGVSPRCCVRPTAVSGVSVKLDTHSPSICSFLMPARSIRPASARARNQCAARIE